MSEIISTFLVVITVTSLVGCGGIQREWTNLTGELTYKCSNQGVEIIQSDSGIAINLDRNGKPVPCGG